VGRLGFDFVFSCQEPCVLKQEAILHHCCHFLLQCMKVKSESEVTQSYPTLSNPMDCRLPGSSVHGIFQTRVLELGAIAFSGVMFYISSNSSKLLEMDFVDEKGKVLGSLNNRTELHLIYYFF